MKKNSPAQTWLNHLSSEAKFFREQLDQELKVVNQILDGLGRPDKSFDYRVIVGGTAGKGTTTRSVEQTLESYGIKTALISSPHIQVITERIRIGGQIISAEDFETHILAIKTVAEKLEILPTYYEAIVLAGILAARNAGVAVLICEVGIGGDLDAVNAVSGPRIAAVTFIGDDHLEMFDNSLEKLATAKAGIFTADSIYNVSFEKKFRNLFIKIAGNPVEFVAGIQSKLTKKLAKKICMKILGKPVMMKPILLPCRWEKIDLDDGKQLILDGAHSAPRFEYILPKIKKLTGTKTLIFGMTKNHKPDGLENILSYFDSVIWTEISGEREVWSAHDLQKKFGLGLIETDPVVAFTQSKNKTDKIVVMGSLYLGGIIRNKFYPAEQIRDQQTEWPI
jgi:folylpolyglutamate synthase/dihydropteroate synthase